MRSRSMQVSASAASLLNAANRRCTQGLCAYQWMMEVDRSKDVRLFCSHDAIESKAFADGSSSSQN
ncbi:hypothetical protein E5S67_02236 [Microcoleus sp. IPMA8]|uniref:Uncharacterized protein n=1 Tax=Microcoleus asticus IPMA8 TaxID=2563858 RepID=A0ABX2CVS9_9CYAN|nr:hypothetical protein [Microcoleus asticus IPMA8]